VAAAAVLVLGAYLFGTGLQADTSASVAPSALGSSAANARSLQSVARSPLGSSLTAVREASASSSVVDYASLGLSSAAATQPESLAELEARWASFYAGLDKAMTAAGARPSRQTSSSVIESSGSAQSTWIKPEGIDPSAATESAAEQYQWIKPEGIRSK
jgi:hypothetical protein